MSGVMMEAQNLFLDQSELEHTFVLLCFDF